MTPTRRVVLSAAGALLAAGFPRPTRSHWFGVRGGGQAQSPTAVLFHGCHASASAADWGPLREALESRGVRVVAPELPGHGDAAGPRISATGDNTAWMAAWRAGTEGLLTSVAAEVRGRGAVIAVGAGCGGFIALEFVRRAPAVAFVTLSGLADPGQLGFLRSGPLPVLGIAATDDGVVPGRVFAIVGSAQALAFRSQFLALPGRDHGTALLTGRPETVGLVLDWLKPFLGSP